MKNKLKYKWGDILIVDQGYVRCDKKVPNPRYKTASYWHARILNIRFWNPEPIKPIKVMVIGYRTLQDGEIWFEEVHSRKALFSPNGHFQALLVAPVDKLNKNPFYTAIP